MILPRIISVFPICTSKDCHQIFDHRFCYIIDDGEDKCFVDSSSETIGDFKIKNNDLKEINFLAIDKCIFDNSAPPKRCDFALFDDSSFTLVEIKKPTSAKARSVLKKEAVEQLKTTIIEFIDNGIFEKDKLILEAIICFTGKRSYPTITSSKLSKVIEFQTEFDVFLKEGNFKMY